ncbi:mechanosensitive ion channel protein MscS [Scytonema hofmannii PCC 7110]|uniref:Mechanosensitive ion channel protein MscS n=1 Tax=Scytonema hofmannii PCC 7110 TaxID=128403 RepID=A0A139XHQ3_9CYAN|nr:mechanosensitive ion channel family protein [Scytonema hofmannii]KYC44220.1 mechanosensitive ion channel protein MscS [Scytonema hofmannii PCC 7110]
MPPATAQIPFLPTVQTPTTQTTESDTRVVSRWVALDGRSLFQVAAPRANISERLEQINQNLETISQSYFQSSTQDPKVEVTLENQIPVIRVNGRYLMTITQQDANLRQVEPKEAATRISQLLEEQLREGKQERQPKSLIRQGGIAAAVGLTMLLVSLGLNQWQKRSSKRLTQQLAPTPSIDKPITTQLKQQQNRHMHEVRRRLFQLAQAGLWGGGTYFILGLFPVTRVLQLEILAALQIPLRLGVVALGTYVAIRFSYALIDRFTSAIVNSSVLLTPETSERLQLRVSTISGVAKSVVTIILVVAGILAALTSLGINILPLLAGAGLVGVAVSLASQNLIKDAINGFLIIAEDQYAVGDVIDVGNVGGLVESLNLRMTQLRDAEGRLISIPNSEIKIVANRSSRWSRADLTIPVAYDANIDGALELIGKVALEMDADPKWQYQIVETPQVLGVDNFGDRGLIIRVWIKTQPLKQWDVAREYRRRLKVAFDQVGISIPVPQQAIWINDGHLLKSSLDGRGN